MSESYDRECEIDGKRTPFDNCSSCSLEEAKASYSDTQYVRWTYIGSGTKIWVNGVEQGESETPWHFFTKEEIR